MSARVAGGAMPKIAYVTDVEGRWDKLESFADGNPVVTLDAAGRLRVAAGGLFVFGGDAIDRGPAGRRVLAALVDVAQRQPAQVVLLAGNRDINKLRLARELHGEPPAKTPAGLRDPRDAPGRAALLRWILEHTMGARDAFEHRRTELGLAADDAGDDAVVASFLADLAEGGLVRAYLGACRLAFRCGETLFVHGAVTSESLGRVPGVGARIDSVDAWVAALNEFYARGVAAFCEGARDGTTGAPAWQPLVDYQAPLGESKANQQSVVYGRPVDELGNPLLPPRVVTEALARAGVGRVVVGHTPSGDCPGVVRDAAGFELVLADNSYGRIERGARVLIDGARLEVTGLTELDSGARREVRFALDLADTGSPLGLRDAATGRLVKARLSDGDFLTFRKLPERRVEQLAVTPEQLARVATEPPPRDEP